MFLHTFRPHHEPTSSSSSLYLSLSLWPHVLVPRNRSSYSILRPFLLFLLRLLPLFLLLVRGGSYLRVTLLVRSSCWSSMYLKQTVYSRCETVSTSLTAIAILDPLVHALKAGCGEAESSRAEPRAACFPAPPLMHLEAYNATSRMTGRREVSRWYRRAWPP